MPTDRKNQDIKEGDIVLIPAIVTKVEAVDDFHNLVCETVEPLRPAEHKTTLLLNSRQVEVVHPSLGVLVVAEQAPGEKHESPTAQES